MASEKAVALLLATLQEAFPTRQVTPQTAEVWTTAFADIDDVALMRVGYALVNEPGRRFFPTTGELRGVLAPPPPPPVDVTGLLRAIQQLGEYKATVGWINPRVEAVRGQFGDAVAGAYGQVGPGRLYAENDTTRDIALMEFTKELRTLSEAAGDDVRAMIGVARGRPRISA